MAEVAVIFAPIIIKVSQIMNKLSKIFRQWRKPQKKHPTIKIIGVGCGGGNVINHIHDLGNDGISLAVCDLDETTLKQSKASITLQLGHDGLGAGNNPELGHIEAEKKIEDIRTLLKDKTEITFIVTCLGGGCGTGVAPVIARESKKLGLTTVSVATIPFEFEGNHKYNQALHGIREITKHSDALFLLNNQYIIKHHSDLSMMEAFANADKLMCGIIKSIINFIKLSPR